MLLRINTVGLLVIYLFLSFFSVWSCRSLKPTGQSASSHQMESLSSWGMVIVSPHFHSFFLPLLQSSPAILSFKFLDFVCTFEPPMRRRGQGFGVSLCKREAKTITFYMGVWTIHNSWHSMDCQILPASVMHFLVKLLGDCGILPLSFLALFYNTLCPHCWRDQSLVCSWDFQHLIGCQTLPASVMLLLQ